MIKNIHSVSYSQHVEPSLIKHIFCLNLTRPCGQHAVRPFALCVCKWDRLQVGASHCEVLHFSRRGLVRVPG
jgi:hypothetical protein